MNKDYYNGFAKIYFEKIINKIIEIGNLNDQDKTILDFGCGTKFLEKKLNKKILNYDINKDHTEIVNIFDYDFNVMVINHVLMYMSQDQIQKLFKDLRLKNENCELIVGIGRMSFLNKLAATLAFNFKAHDGTKTSPTEQLKIISEYVEIISKKTVFYMTDIYLLKFRDKI